MLHEAAHALAARRGIKDTSAAGNRYHNKRFVTLAAELGLRGPDVPDKVTGWSDCTLTGQAAYESYADLVAAIDTARLPFLVDLTIPAGPGGGGEEDQGDEGRAIQPSAADGGYPPSAPASPGPGASSSPQGRSRTADHLRPVLRPVRPTRRRRPGLGSAGTGGGGGTDRVPTDR